VRWVEGIIPAALQAAPIHPNAVGTFRPGEPLKRNQAVQFLWHLLEEPAPGVARSFPDVRAEAAWAPATAWAVDEGLVGAFRDGTFRPKDPATRGVAVTWLYRLAWTEDAWSATSARPAALLF